MDIIRRIRRFESRIAETVDAAAQRMPPATREPLEIVHDIVGAVEKRVEPGTREICLPIQSSNDPHRCGFAGNTSALRSRVRIRALP